jgi:hypothetical protein
MILFKCFYKIKINVYNIKITEKSIMYYTYYIIKMSLIVLNYKCIE